MIHSRRFFLKRAAAFIAMPAIIPIGHLMPVRGIIQPMDLTEPTISSLRASNWDINGLRKIFLTYEITHTEESIHLRPVSHKLVP
jgi:hypothetical protein